MRTKQKLHQACVRLGEDLTQTPASLFDAMQMKINEYLLHITAIISNTDRQERADIAHRHEAIPKTQIKMIFFIINQHFLPAG